jgi:hypothetical protein
LGILLKIACAVRGDSLPTDKKDTARLSEQFSENLVPLCVRDYCGLYHGGRYCDLTGHDPEYACLPAVELMAKVLLAQDASAADALRQAEKKASAILNAEFADCGGVRKSRERKTK